MKNLFLTLLPLLSFMMVSCDTHQDTKLTDRDKAVIKSELTSIVKQIVANSEAGNLDKAIEPYADVPEFISVSNGSISDYDSFVKTNKEYFDGLEHQTFKETALKFTYIDKTTVIVTYGGSALATLKNQQKIKIDPYAATLIFKKLDDFWKVIYTHESEVFTQINNHATKIQ